MILHNKTKTLQREVATAKGLSKEKEELQNAEVEEKQTRYALFVTLNPYSVVITLMLLFLVIEIGSENDGFVDVSEKTQ